MRTFTFTDGKSNKFWSIDLQGKGFTVQFGKVGTAGQTQAKEFADEAAAKKEHDKLVAEKLRKGYVETTRAAGSLRDSLEQALVEDPDDLASHMAYADHLSEQGDPRGDFIRVQLALEDPARPPAERNKLKKQEEQLLKAHRKAWLGELAPFLIDSKEKHESSPYQSTYGFARGWLHTLEVKHYSVAFTRALARSPELRLLSRLVLDENAYEEEGDYPLGNDIPEDSDDPQLFPLVRCPYLTNVRTFVVGEMLTPKEEGDPMFNCQTKAEGVVGVIKRMPKIEELYLLAHDVDTEDLFGLRTLDHLRVLQLYHLHRYPLARLAKNPSLGKLTHLLCHPHAIEYGDDPYIRLPELRAVVRSTTLKSLTHLRLRLTDFGDKGIEEIIASGILARLKMLDLMHGRVTDAGARALAACPALKSLELLDLTCNCLTKSGIAALRAAGVKLFAEEQWHGDDDWRNYLQAGDIE
jgi:uncharacterized protein (TIGR02996 family)